MKTIYINNKSNIEIKNMSKKDFLDTFDLNMRDLRPVFSILQVATILPRKDSVIINLGFIKTILSHNQIYFLQQFNSERFEIFFKKIQNKIHNQKLLHNNFFLFFFEQILDSKSSQMSGKIQNLYNNIQNILKDAQNNLSEINLKKLLLVKKQITKLDNRLNEILNAIEEILEDEENFYELIRLSKIDQKSHMELESILENFLEQMEDEMRKINQMKEDVEDTEDYINLILSNKRTKIVKFDLIATIFTLSLTITSVIVGLYGVNLYNGLEHSQIAFKILSIVLIIILIIINSILF